MTSSKLTKVRAKLLAELEHIVGKNCYNGNIQNYGAGGSFEGEGRHFRYPLTMIDEGGNKRKRSYPPVSDIPPEMVSTGYYAFGANRLHIIKALSEVLQMLEDRYDVKF